MITHLRAALSSVARREDTGGRENHHALHRLEIWKALSGTAVTRGPENQRGRFPFLVGEIRSDTAGTPVANLLGG